MCVVALGRSLQCPEKVKAIYSSLPGWDLNTSVYSWACVRAVRQNTMYKNTAQHCIHIYVCVYTNTYLPKNLVTTHKKKNAMWLCVFVQFFHVVWSWNYTSSGFLKVVTQHSRSCCASSHAQQQLLSPFVDQGVLALFGLGEAGGAVLCLAVWHWQSWSWAPVPFANGTAGECQELHQRHGQAALPSPAKSLPGNPACFMSNILIIILGPCRKPEQRESLMFRNGNKCFEFCGFIFEVVSLLG